MSLFRWAWKVIFNALIIAFLLIILDILFDIDVVRIGEKQYAYIGDMIKSSKEKGTDMLSQKITLIDQSKLCSVLKKNTTRLTDLQREIVIENITGKIIEWELPVRQVSRGFNNIYKIETYNPSSFKCENVPTLISLVILNDNDLSRIKSLKKREKVYFRGKITGSTRHHIIINPAVFSDTAWRIQK